MSSYLLSDAEKVVLSLGLKFLPLDKIDNNKLTNSYKQSIDKLERKLKLCLFFKSNDYTPPCIPMNTTAPKWNPPPQKHDHIINNYTYGIKSKLNAHLYKNPFAYNDTDGYMHTILKKLQKNNAIVIKPADKNLGLTILNLNDYTFMCKKHLLDAKTYSVVNNYTPTHGYQNLKSLLIQHNKMFEPNRKHQTISKLAASLTQLESSDDLRIPPFYCIPKIHKTIIPPIPGRPIVSSVSTMTYHASVYLDMQFQPILKLLHTVCTSANIIIKDMNEMHFKQNSVILCADVTALYPNIPINLGIQTVHKVLTDLHYFSPSHLLFLMDLLKWVLTHNYCTFQDIIYLQIEGTAMGTPVATSYANIFLYGIEHDILKTYKPAYYKRYIDDIFAIFELESDAHAFIIAFNSKVNTITLEAVTISREGIMLDLQLKLIPSSCTLHDIITHKLYQKPANIYQYIPFMSNHKTSIFKNFIIQELCRYKLNCTEHDDFIACQNSFTKHLLVRGYRKAVIDSAILVIPDRDILIQKIKNRLNHPKPRNSTQLIVTLLQPKTKYRIDWKDIFEIPHYLKEYPYFHDLFKNTNITIGNKNPPTISSYVLRSSSSTKS